MRRGTFEISSLELVFSTFGQKGFISKHHMKLHLTCFKNLMESTLITERH